MPFSIKSTSLQQTNNQQPTISWLHLQSSYLGQHTDVFILFMFSVYCHCMHQKMVVVSPAQMCIVLSCCFHGCICAKTGFVFGVLLFWYHCFLLLCPFYDIFYSLLCKCYHFIVFNYCQRTAVEYRSTVHRGTFTAMLIIVCCPCEHWRLTSTKWHKLYTQKKTDSDRTLTSVPCCISNL